MDYIAHRAPLSMWFPRQEYWSELPFPSPRVLPYPGFESIFCALAGGFLTTEPRGKSYNRICCSVAKSYMTLCNPMDSSISVPSVLHYLLGLAQTHVHWVYDAIQSLHPLSPPSPPALNLPRHHSSPMSRPFTSGGQSIGVSASASVLPMNIHGWFPLGLTGLIFLLSKGLSRIFSSTTIRKHQLFGT